MKRDRYTIGRELDIRFEHVCSEIDRLIESDDRVLRGEGRPAAMGENVCTAAG